MYEKEFYFLFKLMFLKNNGGSEKTEVHLPKPHTPTPKKNFLVLLLKYFLRNQQCSDSGCRYKPCSEEAAWF